MHSQVTVSKKLRVIFTDAGVRDAFGHQTDVIHFFTATTEYERAGNYLFTIEEEEKNRVNRIILQNFN